MSYQYGQFGTGFSLKMPDPRALRFNEAVQLRGEKVVLVHQALTGEDAYGNPVYSESTSTEKAIVSNQHGERLVPPGEIDETKARILLRQWAPVTKGFTEIEIGGKRFHVRGCSKMLACLEVMAWRKVDD